MSSVTCNKFSTLAYSNRKNKFDAEAEMTADSRNRNFIITQLTDLQTSLENN